MQNKKTKIAVLVLILATIVGAVIWFSFYKATDDYVKQGVNYAPPTKSDKEYNDSIKDSLSNEEAPATQEQNGKQEVTPIISSWGQPAGPGTDFKINGYVPTIVETGGTCTLTLTNDATSVSATKSALQNAQDTSCGQLSIEPSRVSTGTWTAVLSYESAEYIGSSEPTEIEVR